MTYLFRLIGLILFATISCFFLIFGIQLLNAAYHLNNPFYFIMTFFSASLIILISAALLLGMIWRVIMGAKGDKSNLE